MTDGIVGWHFFDAESGLVPEELSPSGLPGGGTGRIVALAATPFAQAEGWASRAVVAIAKEWAQKGLRIFLMDLGLDAPTLHRALGILNREGVSDAFLYGASVQRIAQPALDDLIFFAPAGTATTDPEQILGHPRWNDLAGGFSEADATLLLYLPTDIPGAEKILSRATDVLFLAGQVETAEDHLGPASIKVVAMAGPAGSPPGGSSPEPEIAEVDEDEAGAGEPGGVFDFGDGVFPGSESPGQEASMPDRTLSIAEGFLKGLEADQAEPEDSESEPFSGMDLEPEPAAADGFRLERADDPSDGFPGEGMVSLAGAEEPPDSPSQFGDQGIPAMEVPDFGAEFAELPPVEAEPAAVGPEDGEMVSGSGFRPDDFGGPPLADGAGDPPGPQGGLAPGQEEVAGKRYTYPPDRKKPVSKLRPQPKPRFSIPFIAGTVILASVLVAAGGTAAGLFNVPGFTWLQGLFGDVPYPELALQGPEPIEPVLRFSLELDVYEEDELGVAIEMRNALRQRLPGLLFNLSARGPEESASYVLYAGPAVDAVEAENLRVPISGVITREDPDSWPIRTTPRAFFLGTAETFRDAQEFLVSVEADGGLGYILHVTYPDGAEGYQILSGAFGGVEEARFWQLALRRSGFREAPLIERRGRPPE